MKIREQLHKQLKNLSKADLHIHSNFSDAYPSIEEILDYVEENTNLQVIAITDHDTIDGALYAKELAKKKKYRFDIVIGEEVSSKEGHILALFIHERIKPKQSAHETIKQIHEQGGLAIPAHPFYHSRMNNRKTIWADGVGAMTLLKEKDNIDGIETINATPTFAQENLRAKYINRAILLKAETGSSDAHILEAIGKGYTLFEGKTAEDLRESIEGHLTQAMNDHWDLMGLFRYAYFFWPRGLRTAVNTIIFGPRKKRKDQDLIKFPSKSRLKKEMTNVEQ